MFTIGDLSDIAIQIEKNGKETYRRASRAVADADAAALLERLADEEERHARWFADLPAGPQILSEKEKQVEEMGRALLQDILKSGRDFLHDPEVLERSSDVDEVLATAKKFEEETIVFYEFLLALLDDQGSIARLKEIIAEERRHIGLLAELQNSPGMACRTR